MDGTETVYVVIPVHNRCEYTQECLRLLAEQTYGHIQVVVVDDGSIDGTGEMIEKNFPEVDLLKGDGSLYWTGSVHMGVERVMQVANHDDYVWVLNDDLTFEKNVIKKMVLCAQKHPRALIQAVGLWTDRPEVIHFAGRRINWWSAARKPLHAGRKITDFSEGYVEKSDTLTGRGVLVPIRAFKDAGNYDRRYQQSGDPEFTRRVAKVGYDLLVYFGARVYSYPREGKGNINERDFYYVKDFIPYFFGVLSQARVKTRYLNAKSYCDSGVQSAVFFLMTMLRLSWHFIVRFRLAKMKREH